MAARILIVEDDPDSLELLSTLLETENYETVGAETGAEALRRACDEPFDLILLDLMLPDMDGVNACRELKRGPSANVPVIILTAKMATPQKVAGLEAGADDYITKPFENAELIARIKARLRIRALEEENARGRAELEKANEHLKQHIAELETNFAETVAALSAAIEARDPATRDHLQRVVQYASRIGQRLHLSDRQMKNLYYAALLHDIGKIAIPHTVLEKKSKLSGKEIEELKRHPEISESILKPIGFLKEVLPVIRHHHEFLNGKGYPDALSGEGIPIESRIIAVADAYDAMTSTRPYRAALSKPEAIERIKAGAGKQFDTKATQTLLEILSEGERHPGDHVSPRTQKETG